jgi:Mrp family chromosome partitioning ATPase
MVVAGKGGVGKTTVSAALALTAARAGLRTLLVDVEATGSLPALFGHRQPLDYHAVILHRASGRDAEITGRTLTPDDALLEYLDSHGLRRVSKRMTTTGTLDLVATAIPGIKDILVLGKVKQLEQAARSGEGGAVDFIVVDAPAAGHAVTFLSSAHGMIDAIGVGPIRAQAAEVIELLGDPARCQVLLVTLPEETPVNEAVETAFHLEDRAGVLLGPIVVNGLYPTLDLPADAAAAALSAEADVDEATISALAAAGDFRRHRQDLQAAQVERLSSKLPLAQLRLPYLWTTDLGRPELDHLADALTDAIVALPAGSAA